MGMLVVRVYSFDCDICGEVSEDFAPGGAEKYPVRWARREATSRGWSFAGRKTGCPAHPVTEGSVSR